MTSEGAGREATESSVHASGEERPASSVLLDAVKQRGNVSGGVPT